MKPERFGLPIETDPATGQLLRLRDPLGRIDLLRFEAGPELEMNGLPLALRPTAVEEAGGEHLTTFEARVPSAYGAAATLRVRRVLTLGGAGSHPGPADSVHLRYEVRRVPNRDCEPGTDYLWQPEIEAPLSVDSLGVLCAPAAWFGPQTRMRAIAIGGSGPREHVGIEDGPVAEVAARLQSDFRSAFPGQQTVSGALYYHPRDERWVWVVVRRPATGGRVEFGPRRMAFRFWYFAELPLQRELFAPAVSLFWGRGLAAAERALARQFDLYEEPPDWWWRTAWFWLHPGWSGVGGFAGAAEGAQRLMDEGGVRGFGLLVHDIPWSGNDVDPGSMRPAPGLGGEDGLRRLVGAIRERGGHTYAWISRTGHRASTLGWRESWGIRGVDGRPVRLRGRPDRGVTLDIVDPADPTFLDHTKAWVRHYVEQLGITGLFWDSGFQPVPPDFGGKPYLRWPAESMSRARAFYEEVYRFGRSLSRDFFMWVEGISVDFPANAFAVDGRSHGGHALLRRIAHAGPRRLAWRSAWPHDLASGFPFVRPFNDVGWRRPHYRAVAADPANRWLCRVLAERGCRHAVGLADGVSRLDEFVVACPGISGAFDVPAERWPGGRRLKHALTGATGRVTRRGRTVRLVLPASGPYAVE